MKMKVAVLGAGGLGQNAAKIIDQKKEMDLVAICDKSGVAFNENGLEAEDIINTSAEKSTVGEAEYGFRADDSIGEVIKISEWIDGVFVALPNLPNTFIPTVVERFIDSGYEGAMVDVLKRTSAVKMLFDLEDKFEDSRITYITGAGATPGLLSAAAALASNSFVEIESVNIYFGVGIGSWEEYKATVREDIAHMEGFNVDKVSRMSNSQIEEELKKRNWKLELVGMEHADDILLERMGIVSKDKVQVGGIVDVKSSKKPVSTTMTIRGRTFDGRISEHRFILGDETQMAANVIGTALGYLKTAYFLNKKGINGVFGSTELMPRFVK